MSWLRIYPEDDPKVYREVLEYDSIASELKERNILFERWVADRSLAIDASQQEILDAYRLPVDRLMKARGFVTADVISVHPDTPNHAELRKKFLDEHTHSEDEARFFVDGCGIFYIHTNREIAIVTCEKGDFIDLPPRTSHWFDLGPAPRLKVIRTFTTPEGWVADYTGSDIASRFPRFETLVPMLPVTPPSSGPKAKTF